MAQRAASCTVNVGSYVYTFINRPNTDHIDYVRFHETKPSTEAESGKIGTRGEKPISVQSGPLSCTTFFNRDNTTDIRIYYLSNGMIKDAKLLDVSKFTNLKSEWIVPDAKTDKISVSVLDRNTRAVDQTSYMASGRTAGNDSEPREPQLPYVVYQSAGQPDVIKYAWASGTGEQTHWDTSTLPVKLVPADSA